MFVSRWRIRLRFFVFLGLFHLGQHPRNCAVQWASSSGITARLATESSISFWPSLLSWRDPLDWLHCPHSSIVGVSTRLGSSALDWLRRLKSIYFRSVVPQYHFGVCIEDNFNYLDIDFLENFLNSLHCQHRSIKFKARDSKWLRWRYSWLAI